MTPAGGLWVWHGRSPSRMVVRAGGVLSSAASNAGRRAPDRSYRIPRNGVSSSGSGITSSSSTTPSNRNDLRKAPTRRHGRAQADRGSCRNRAAWQATTPCGVRRFWKRLLDDAVVPCRPDLLAAPGFFLTDDVTPRKMGVGGLPLTDYLTVQQPVSEDRSKIGRFATCKSGRPRPMYCLARRLTS